VAGVVAFVSTLDAAVEGWEEEIGLGLGLGEGDAGPEAAGEGDHVAVLADGVVDVRGEDVHFGAGRVDGAEVEGVGKDADDGVGGVAEGDGFADDIGVAVELALPEWVAEDDDRGTAGLGLLGGEDYAAHEGLDTEGMEEVIHDIDLGDGDGNAAAGELPVAGRGEGVVAGEVGEGYVLALELLNGVGGVGGAGGSALGNFGGDADQAVRFGEWERAQQDGVDDGEDDDVGADAESEDENGDGGEAGVAAEGAEGVAEVLEEDVEPGEAAGFALVFFCLLDSAETDEGAAAGLFGGYSVAYVFFDGEVDVALEFGVQVGVALWFVKEGENAVEGFASGCH